MPKSPIARPIFLRSLVFVFVSTNIRNFRFLHGACGYRKFALHSVKQSFMIIGEGAQITGKLPTHVAFPASPVSSASNPLRRKRSTPMIRMGRGSKNDTPDTTPVQNYNNTPTSTQPTYQYQSEAVAAPSRAVTDSESMARDIKEGRLSGFVGHGTVLTGETNFEAMLRVDGHLMGTVASESGTLLVGTNGQVDANISVAAALVNGNVN